MTVRELIAALSAAPPDAAVTVEHDCQGFPVGSLEVRGRAVVIRGKANRCPHGYPSTVRCSRCGE